MGLPAARVGDLVVCPVLLGATIPIIGPGVPNVNIGGMPAATVGSLVCTPPDALIKGSTTVFISGLPAARMGDNSPTGATILAGAPNVFIGG